MLADCLRGYRVSGKSSLATKANSFLHLKPSLRIPFPLIFMQRLVFKSSIFIGRRQHLPFSFVLGAVA
ncbi:hypothetical protein L2E82_51610 [Cichorium intybus]|nr:hypothetical protein L2E82_51610 [Cichorium intybus]